MKKSIILIGMSGVGKTTIGKALSIELNKNFIDIDQLIEKESKMKIKDIFSQYGEPYFRELEYNMTKKISNYKNYIIATGGGVILNQKNIENLKTNGILVYLSAGIDTLAKNLQRSSNVRPLLSDKENLYKDIEKLYENRKNLYLASADYNISIDGKSINEIVYEIIDSCVKINS